MNSKLLPALKEYRDTIIIALICIPLGAVIGAIDAVFGRVLLAITTFRGEHIYLLIPFLALAGALIVFCYSRYGKGSDKGMGLIFAAGHGETDDIPLRLVPFVVLSTWITHLFGGSAGREGVAVQIGGTLSFWVGKKLPLRNAKRIFLIAGMAAGFAGLFRTPLAAVCFALEVMIVGEMALNALIPSLLAAFTASTVSGLLGLEKFAVPLTTDTTLSLSVFWKMLLLGAIFGLVGGAFAGVLAWLKKTFAKIMANPILRIVIVGVIVSALLLLAKGRYAGLGTNLISASFTGETIYSWDWILKFAFTVLTLAAGFQGGEVTPLFSIGASLGIILGSLLGLPIELTAALGYAAVFGSASNTFLAPVLIGAEVFGFAHLPFFFIVCAVAFFCNGNKSIYGKQKLRDMIQL